ncbi:HET-domain-containing protein [Periconia macrospinosa]|uniref:HET-domain-containing protein n=1 Tax=Periconia macrospinosa TaxID=97972 RepID=A0A2V1DMA7_9PLEO|nr:HET-domain-containing protein [Periconia macrospinosa]
MPLCNLCSNIPWEKLPTVPPGLPGNLTGHKYIQPILRWPQGVRGYEHHRNLSALRHSALSCDLCNLICSSANNVENQLEELRPKWEANEMTEYDWPTYELFVVKRREGGDGCWVLSFVDGNGPRAERRKGRKGTVGRYVSLSYCWGHSQEFTTTRATMEARKAGITVADMPETYQDIIKITRELGLRYLWVDSLCICQDDRADWEKESTKMLSIYSNAYVTVSAIRAKDSSQGFLGPRSDRKFIELDYTREGLQQNVLVFNLPMKEEFLTRSYINLRDEPLSQRAWSLQERALSHRVLIYGSDQMYFECNQGFKSEDGLYLKAQHNSAGWLERLKLEGKSKKDLFQEWYNTIRLYGPRKLTRATDKLPALSGIAGLYAEKIKEEYLAGLWKDHLVEGLAWQSLGFRRVEEYRAPSWSWASGDGYPASIHFLECVEIAEIIDAKVTLKGSNPFGEVTDGYIKLRAPMEQLHMMTENWNPEVPGHYPYYNNVKVRTAKGNPEGFHSRFDFNFTADDAPEEARKIVKSLEGIELFALLLLINKFDKKGGVKDKGTYHALIVKRVGDTEIYQRLGFLLCDNDDIGREPEKEDREGFSTITLV